MHTLAMELTVSVCATDGGGVRGYSMLIIVQELMHRYVYLGTMP